MRVDIVGRGRLGRSLDVLWRRCGLDVRLLGRGEAPAGDVTVLAVPDRAVADVARTLPDLPTLHLSGSLDLACLRHLSERGSLHPLMTFPGPEVALPDLSGVPAAIDGTPRAAGLATELALRLGMRVVHVPGDRRLYHCAAVMAGNFGTTLLGHAAAVLQHAGVAEADAAPMLAPLALQSLRNASAGPREALTGPVARGDLAVIEGHRAALRAHGLTDALQLYDAMVIATGKLLASGDVQV